MFFLTALNVPLPLKAEEQIYLMLMTNKGEAHSTFPMKDTAHCKEEGKKMDVYGNQGSKRKFKKLLLCHWLAYKCEKLSLCCCNPYSKTASISPLYEMGLDVVAPLSAFST